MTDLDTRVTRTPDDERVLNDGTSPPSGIVSRLADRLGAHHPAAAAAITMTMAYVVIATVTAAFGLLLTNVLVADGRGSWDVIGVNQWFADRFTPEVDRWSGLGSTLGDTLTVVGIAAILTVVFLVARHWRAALFLVVALTLEVTVFLTMTLLIDRARPDVPKPDEVPPTSSYPSGHTAASVALYTGIALLIASRVRHRVARAVIIVLGLLPGIAVGVSRIARGMHHPSDTIVGLLLGLACLAAAGLVVAVADAVATRRSRAAEVTS